MASIITATTTSGLTQSADNSGVLQLASGTGNLVTVPSVTGTAMVSGNMPAFSASAATGTALSAGTFTKITYDTEEFDTNSNFASSRFTPTVAGYYQVNASVYFNVATSAERLAAIYKNGTVYKWGADLNTVVSSACVSCLVYLNGSTDYIEVYAYSAGALTTGTGSNVAYFQASMVRGA